MVVKQGSLMKEGKHLVKLWQPRWVVLTDRFLYYWATAADFLSNKWAISLLRSRDEWSLRIETCTDGKRIRFLQQQNESSPDMVSFLHCTVLDMEQKILMRFRMNVYVSLQVRMSKNMAIIPRHAAEMILLWVRMVSMSSQTGGATKFHCVNFCVTFRPHDQNIKLCDCSEFAFWRVVLA